MRAFRWLFITGGILVVLIALAIAVGAVWLNSFIHSDAFRQEMESRAGRTLGGTVQIQAIDYSLFGRIQLRGFVTQIDSSRVNGQGAVVARVATVDCTYSLVDLLSRRLKLTSVILDKPQIVLTRQPASTVLSPTLAASDSANTGLPDQPGGSPEPFQFILEAAQLKNGSLSIRNATGVPVADLQGLNAEADTAGYYTGKAITGKVRVADMILASNLHLTDFSMPFVYRAGAIDAQPLEATAFHGRLAGDYEVGLTGPSSLEVNAKGLDVSQIGQMADPTSKTHLTGSLDFQSKWHGVETGQGTGEGDAELTNGRLEGVRVLQDLAGVLRVKELADPQLRKVQTHFEFAQGQTRFTGLQLDAIQFQMTGDGVIGSDGGLNADLVLILTPDSMTRLPREAALFFVQRPDGSGTVAFHLGGTITNPRTDLATRLFIPNMQLQNVIGNALNRFFHKHAKPQPKLPPASEPTPSASPSSDTNLAPPADTPPPPASTTSSQTLRPRPRSADSAVVFCGSRACLGHRLSSSVAKTSPPAS
jgi:hypothetical protein